MAKTLCVVLGDQLTLSLSSLQAIDKKSDRVLMAELWDETQYVKHHKKKLVFVLSAMRHFKLELDEAGYQVDYYQLDKKNNFSSFTTAVEHALKQHSIETIVITHPGEYRVLQEIKSWQEKYNITVNLLEDDRFLSSQQLFTDWASSRKQLRMEYFYRELRQQYSILMEDNKPVGGKWNYDADNRKPPKADLKIPAPTQFKPDKITKDVIKLVEKKFSQHFGEIEPFNYAVTRQQALKVLAEFIEHRLIDFGTYQDAMLANEAWMFHAHISLYLNCGLLVAKECIQKAEDAYKHKKVSLHSVEGFIRQILGWREYIRGFYWHMMPQYENKNYFLARRKLPEFYWTAKTKMNCLQQCVSQTKAHAYAHHIQRLMVLGNFALLASIAPKEVNEWFMIVYADAYQWVELPNVTGMALFADGGIMASKPYAAGGNYIHKMSNYCKNCHYDVKQKTGDKACPFNYLYWDFLARHNDKLANNQRLSMIYKTWDKMSAEKKKAIKDSAKKFLASDELS
jgi:deoxyribodipyrimidine photolyase-related protein